MSVLLPVATLAQSSVLYSIKLYNSSHQHQAAALHLGSFQQWGAASPPSSKISSITPPMVDSQAVEQAPAQCNRKSQRKRSIITNCLLEQRLQLPGKQETWYIYCHCQKQAWHNGTGRGELQDKPQYEDYPANRLQPKCLLGGNMTGGNWSLCTHSQNASTLYIFFLNCLCFLRLLHCI